MCTKPFSQTKNKGKLFLVAKSSGPLLVRMPLNSVIGRQLDSERRFEPSFGTRVITPLRWETDISPFLYA